MLWRPANATGHLPAIEADMELEKTKFMVTIFFRFGIFSRLFGGFPGFFIFFGFAHLKMKRKERCQTLVTRVFLSSLDDEKYALPEKLKILMQGG